MNYKPIRNEQTGRWSVEGMEPSEDVFKRICDMLDKRIAFKFARYGDGEFNCMFGKIGRNCDGHEYFPDMGRRLMEAFNNANYMVGIQPLAISIYGERIILEGLDIYNADVLHNASIDGMIDQFLHALIGRHIILVGPAHINLLDCVHIVIPSKNCWKEYQNIKNQLAFYLEGVNNAVVLLAASMMSEVVIHEFKDEHHTFIDIGSLLDPYCGVKSRKYHHKLKI